MPDFDMESSDSDDYNQSDEEVRTPPLLQSNAESTNSLT